MTEEQNFEKLYREHWGKAKTLGCQLVAYADQWYSGTPNIDMMFLPGWDFRGFDHPEFINGSVPINFSTDLSEFPRPQWFKYVAKAALYSDFVASGCNITYTKFLALMRNNEDLTREIGKTMCYPTARRGIYEGRIRQCVNFN